MLWCRAGAAAQVQPTTRGAPVDPYVEVAMHLPNEVVIGGALITMVEPHRGSEHAYNRWYEDDHFYSGAMQGPWHFAGRRFVSPKRLRALRTPVVDGAVTPPDAGCYLSLYWITKGHEADSERWSYEAMDKALMPYARGFTNRTHVYTAFHRYRFARVRDEGPMKPHLALDAGFAGVVLEVIDAPSEDRLGDLERWLEEVHLASVLPGSPFGLAIVFAPVPFSQGLIDQPGTEPVKPPEGVGRRLCLLWFVDADPYRVAEEGFVERHRALEISGLGTLKFSGTFLPTKVGTDAYVDELR